MLKVGQTVMYRRSVCKVQELIEKFREDQDYFKLAAWYDPSLVIHVPRVSIPDTCRPLLTQHEAEQLIDAIPTIDHIESEDKILESVYKELLNSDDHEDLVKIIKTTYMRSEDKVKKGLKRSEKDKEYFRKAEEVLYNELAVVLDKSIAETRDYVVQRMSAVAA